MDIQEFAEKYGARVIHDDSGIPMIRGNMSHITRDFHLVILRDDSNRWTVQKQKLLEAGLKIRRNYYVEPVVAFDPADDRQVRVILSVAGLREPIASQP